MRSYLIPSLATLALTACHAPPSRSEGPATASSAAPPRPERPMIHLTGGRFLKYLPTISGKNVTTIDPRTRVGTSASPFWIDKFEVTVSDYRACVEAGICPEPDPEPADAGPSLCNWARPGFERDPMNCVAAGDAATYCAWVGARLPYEDEWLFAYQGLEGRDFSWGAKIDPRFPSGLPSDVLARLAKGCPDATHDGTTTCPVGFDAWMATPEGVMDLAGNVAEVTATMSGSVHPEYLVGHYALGPSWELTTADHVVRYARYPTGAPSTSTIGFRCARPEPLPPPPPPSEAPPGPMKRVQGGTVTVLRHYEHRLEDETPDVPPFLLDVNRVTVAQYRACVQAGACSVEGLKGGVEVTFCPWNVPGLDGDPITCIRPPQVAAYCRWAGKRPVKIEEWTLAAGREERRTVNPQTAAGEPHMQPMRPERRRYPWGNALEERHQLDLGSCRDAARGYYVWTCPVDMLRSTNSPEGIRDLVGLVGEWTSNNPGADWYSVRGCANEFASEVSSCGLSGRVAFRCAKDLSP